jgi:hypothetical protein
MSRYEKSSVKEDFYFERSNDFDGHSRGYSAE